MENLTTDFEGIEQQLQELRSRFSKADQVLKDLDQIQIQFESLAETHKKLKGYLAEVSQFNSESSDLLKRIKQAQENFEQRFTELRESNEGERKNFEQRFTELRESNEGERKNFEQRFTELRESNEGERKNFEQRFTKLRETNELKLKDLKLELSEAQNKLNTHGSHIQKLQSSMSLLENNFHDLGNDLGDLHNKMQIFKKLKKQIRIIWYTMIPLFVLCLFLAIFI